ncbi:MAG: hypothetical protein ACU833_02650 [Gammaproteobacteria bacterium]
MMTRIHMQDQITNRIEELMRDDRGVDLDEVLQNAATLTLIAVFLLLGLNW